MLQCFAREINFLNYFSNFLIQSMLQCLHARSNFLTISLNFLIQAGFSALHLAAQNGHNESSRVLLYAGLNNDHKNNVSHTSRLTFCLLGNFSKKTFRNTIRVSNCLDPDQA